MAPSCPMPSIAGGSSRCSPRSERPRRSPIMARRRCSGSIRRPYLDFLKSAFADWKARRPAGRRFGLCLAGRRPPTARPRPDRRPARPVQHRRLDPDRRGHLGERLLGGADGAVGAGRGARRRARRLRALPPARPPCRRRLYGRLLLPQQRGDRRRGGAGGGHRPGRDPRRRLSSRQRHPGHLPRARRRLLRLDPRRSAHRLSLLLGPCRRDAAPAKARARPSTCRCRAAPRFATTRRRSTGRSRRSPASAPDLLICSFGADTFAGDPICSFALETADYAPVARRIASLGLPTLVVMEGGYAVDALGANVAAFLCGF